MDLQSQNLPSQPAHQAVVAKMVAPRPNIFQYTNFRFFLLDFFLHLKSKNSRFSESAFLNKAGFGKNSRGYLKLIISGKRNLSQDSLFSFSQAMQLTEEEQKYFENLTHFNQAKGERDKDIFWKRLTDQNKGKQSKAFRLLQAQYNYYGHWYTIAIREMVALDDFKNDLDYILKKLKSNLSRKDIQLALDDLLDLGLIKMTDDGVLVQTQEVVQFSDNQENYRAVEKFQKQMLEQAKHAIDADAYEDRSVSNVTFACDQKDFPRIREELAKVRKEILEKFETRATKKDMVLNLGMQLIKLTK